MRDRIWGLLGTTAGRLALLVLVVVVAINVGAGITIAAGDFESYPEAAWWSFRHVVDPGALADDPEWDERFVGTGLTLLGIVVFVGVVMALLSDVVQGSLQRLDEHQTAVRARDHTVIYGWSWLLPAVLDGLETLARTDPRAPRTVVVIAAAPLRAARDELQDGLRPYRSTLSTRLLFADPGDTTVLELAQVRSARTVVVMRDDTRLHDLFAADVDVIGRAALLADYLDAHHDHSPRPRVGYHLARDQSLTVAAGTLPDDFTPVGGDRAATGLLRLALLTPAWGRLMTSPPGDDTFAASDLELVPGNELLGRRFDDLATVVPDRLALAVDTTAGLSTAPGHVISSTDVVVTVAVRGRVSVEADPGVEIVDSTRDQLHVLIVGWNERVPALIDDLAVVPDTDIRITSASDVAPERRSADVPTNLAERARATFVVTVPDEREALASLLETTDPDRIVVVSTVTAPVFTPERELPAADARAIVTATLLAGVDPATEREILVDLYLPGSDRPLGRVPRISALPTAGAQAYTLARLAAGLELGTVTTDVFGDDAAPPRVARLTTTDDRPRAFGIVRASGLAAGVSVVGIVVDGEPVMAPAPDVVVAPGTELLVLRGLDGR